VTRPGEDSGHKRPGFSAEVGRALSAWAGWQGRFGFVAGCWSGDLSETKSELFQRLGWRYRVLAGAIRVAGLAGRDTRLRRCIDLAPPRRRHRRSLTAMPFGVELKAESLRADPLQDPDLAVKMVEVAA
jgi:hypothetical protein